MNERTLTQQQKTTTPMFTPVRSNVLQRKCACGQHTVAGGECAECRKRRLSLQRQAVNHEPTTIEGQGQAKATKLHHENVAIEDDFIHTPLIEDFWRREAELGNPAAEELSEAEIKYGGLALSCPTRTTLDRTVDMTPAGLRDGFLTAYGAMTVMRVLPGERTWDGIRVSESLIDQSSTCPATLSRQPLCSGSSVFTVGDPGRSSRLGNQPGLVNSFYDFHVSRSRTISFLHDATRNPEGLDTCEAICEQRYSCGGTVIGRHMVTRRFRKGTHNGQNVTLVDVTKT